MARKKRKQSDAPAFAANQARREISTAVQLLAKDCEGSIQFKEDTAAVTNTQQTVKCNAIIFMVLSLAWTKL
jgi:hypothetical protein